MMATLLRFGITVAAIPLCAEFMDGVHLLDMHNAIVVGAILGSIYYLWIYEKYDMPKKEEHHGDHPADGDR